MRMECPGARLIREPKPEIFICPNCGEEVEIWTDETKRVCPKCKTTVYKGQTQNCLEWCKLAKECVGENIYNTYMKNRNKSIKENLLQEITNNFKNDKTKINHAKEVLKFAEQILLKEHGDWHIVIPAAILHDIDAKDDDEKFNLPILENKLKGCPSIVKRILPKTKSKSPDLYKPLV